MQKITSMQERPVADKVNPSLQTHEYDPSMFTLIANRKAL